MQWNRPLEIPDVVVVVVVVVAEKLGDDGGRWAVNMATEATKI